MWFKVKQTFLMSYRFVMNWTYYGYNVFVQYIIHYKVRPRHVVCIQNLVLWFTVKINQGQNINIFCDFVYSFKNNVGKITYILFVHFTMTEISQWLRHSCTSCMILRCVLIHGTLFTLSGCRCITTPMQRQLIPRILTGSRYCISQRKWNFILAITYSDFITNYLHDVVLSLDSQWVWYFRCLIYYNSTSLTWTLMTQITTINRTLSSVPLWVNLT